MTVGMTHMGFVVESEIPLPSGGNGGGCSSCCGGCGVPAAAIRFETAGRFLRPSRADSAQRRTIRRVSVAQKRFREKSPNERFPCHLAFVHYLLKKTDMALSRICPFPLFIIYSGGNNHVYD